MPNFIYRYGAFHTHHVSGWQMKTVFADSVSEWYVYVNKGRVAHILTADEFERLRGMLNQ